MPKQRNVQDDVFKDAENRMKQARKAMNKSIAEKMLPIDPKKLALSAWPIFGGSPDDPKDPPATNPPAPQPNPTPPPAATPPTGGGKAGEGTPPVNVDVNQLLAQVQTLSAQVQTLTQENTGYKTAETNAENAKKTREQQLETTIQQKDATIAAAQNLIGQKAMENALLTHKEYQFHDANDALLNLKDAEGVTVTVDIDKQIATVEGLDAAIKDLATRKSWMLSKGPETDQQQQQNPPQQTPPSRPSGPPPRSPNNDASKVQQRAALGKKYSAIRQSPVIAG